MFRSNSPVVSRLPSAVLVVFLLTLSTQALAAPPALHDGDLIFQHSKSAQSAAIEEATSSSWTHLGVLMREQSDWYVVEASSGVTVTPLKKFIQKNSLKLSSKEKFLLINLMKSYIREKTTRLCAI